jgi:four helix bundle protein
MKAARHYTELIVWQLADGIRNETYALTRRPPFARDFRLKAQSEDAIESVCRNIAEGFGGSHGQFAGYLGHAKNSLNELQDCFTAAQSKGHVTDQRLKPARSLMRRLFPAVGNLIAYLRRTPHGRGAAPHPRDS